jgi:hypothetical protein
MAKTLTLVATMVVLAAVGTARAEETIGTFRLDGLSFISFGDRQILFPESGSTIVFRFGTPNEDGSVSFTIQPGDVSIAPIPLPSGKGTLRYAIVAPSFGVVRPTEQGRTITFSAAVAATLEAPEGSGTYKYPMSFTTEAATARNVSAPSPWPTWPPRRTCWFATSNGIASRPSCAARRLRWAANR